MSPLPDQLAALATQTRAAAQALRESARRIDQDGDARAAWRRYRHADELDGAARLMEDWARELGREDADG